MTKIPLYSVWNRKWKTQLRFLEEASLSPSSAPVLFPNYIEFLLLKLMLSFWFNLKCSLKWWQQGSYTGSTAMEFHSQTHLLFYPKLRTRSCHTECLFNPAHFPFWHWTMPREPYLQKFSAYYHFIVPVGQDKQAKTAGERIISFPYRWKLCNEINKCPFVQHNNGSSIVEGAP